MCMNWLSKTNENIKEKKKQKLIESEIFFIGT